MQGIPEIMRVLYLTKYTRKGASSRLRSFQYFPLLEQEGFTITVAPLFSDAYLERLYTGKSTVLEALKGYWRRFLILFTVFRYDVIVIEKELFPYLPAFAERLLRLFGKKYVVDYDDAIFHNYDLHPNKAIRFFLKDKIDVVMRLSETVIAGNAYLADRARKAGAKQVNIIPTVIDSNRYAVKPEHSGTKTVIGWIGSPSTFKYVKQLFPVFEKLKRQHDFELHIVGAKSDEKFSFPVRFIDWSEETEVASIQNFDIGIMPLEDSPWEKGKCAYKIIQYMACGLPVVASPVGMNKEVVLENKTGFLPDNLDEWCEVFQILTQDKTKSRNFGASGRQVVENEYTLQGNLRKLTTVLKTI